MFKIIFAAMIVMLLFRGINAFVVIAGAIIVVRLLWNLAMAGSHITPPRGGV